MAATASKKSDVGADAYFIFNIRAAHGPGVTDGRDIFWPRQPALKQLGSSRRPLISRFGPLEDLLSCVNAPLRPVLFRTMESGFARTILMGTA